jgi:ATP-dependent DNA ligase
MKMTNKEFLQYFSNMEPMKYYEGDTNSIKAKDMIENKNDQFYDMEKRDGEWCRAIIGENNILLQSRSVSKVTGTYGDKTELVPHITQELRNLFPAGTVLVGELAFDNHKTTSREVGSILRCKAPKAIERQKNEKLHFFIFDMLSFGYEEMLDWNFEDRFERISVESKFIHRIGTSKGFDTFMNFADSVWSLGGEGIMILRKDTPYMPGKRKAWASLKVKKKLDDFIGTVIDVIEPKENYEGTEIDNWEYWADGSGNPVDQKDIFNMKQIEGLHAVTKPFYFGWKNGVVVEVEGRIVKVTSGLTDADRAWLASDNATQNISNRKLTARITGMELTEDSIRHPIFLNFIN